MILRVSEIRQALRAGIAADVPAASAAMAQAFYADPVWSWMIPDAGRRQLALERFFALEMREFVLTKGTVTVADDLTGGALCFGPGAWRMPTAKALRHGPAFLRIFGRQLHRSTGLLLKMEARHLREPHHYVAYVGVAPEGQGRGLGSQLLGPTLDRADADGLPAYLEASSQRSAALYERLGFEHIGEVRFLGSPPLRLMRRPAG
jgi:ribosomal protein S18 acetylase RimI-like enzyme